MVRLSEARGRGAGQGGVGAQQQQEHLTEVQEPSCEAGAVGKSEGRERTMGRRWSTSAEMGKNKQQR